MRTRPLSRRRQDGYLDVFVKRGAEDVAGGNHLRLRVSSANYQAHLVVTNFAGTIEAALVVRNDLRRPDKVEIEIDGRN
jgi:hypothetical protein